MKRLLFLLVILCLCGPAYAKDKKPVLKALDHVDINRSMGKWYEIARITHWFERDLAGVSAVYTMLPNGDIEMINSGYKYGKYKTMKGKAWLSDKKSNAKLKASFFWPFYANYWIIDIGKRYEYAVLVNPNMKYLWILSRTPTMRGRFYKKIVKRAEEMGFNVSLLDKTEPKPKIDEPTKKKTE